MLHAAFLSLENLAFRHQSAKVRSEVLASLGIRDSKEDPREDDALHSE